MQTFSSKIGLELAIPLSLLLGVVSLLMVYEKAWGGLMVIAFVIAFIVYLFTTTYYQINGRELRVRSGFIIDQTIPIERITRIAETNNPLSSPAFSLDRLEIKYNRYDSVLVSPKAKHEFITALTTINPAIEVKWRKG